MKIPEKYWHLLFEIGIFFKGLDGLLEIIGGALAFFIQPSTINTGIRALTQHELSTDPRDKIANYFLGQAAHISHGALIFAGIFLLSHGIIKIFLVINLYWNRIWAYPAAIAVFTGFGIYQMYKYSHTHSFGLLLLTALDAIVVALTWHEYLWYNGFKNY